MEETTMKTLLELSHKCQSYNTALEIIMNMCKRDKYLTVDNVLLICETVLKEGNEDECTR